jgi:hypothetical protein
MNTTTLVLLVIMAVLLFVYLGRRRSRLNRED